MYRRLQIAISAVSQEFSNQQASKLLKPLMTAVDMVFGSAAALSATFGSKASFLDFSEEAIILALPILLEISVPALSTGLLYSAY